MGDELNFGDISRGEALTLPGGMTLTVPPPPFAYVLRADGQEVRYESPTLAGLLALIAQIDPDGLTRVPRTDAAAN